MLISFGQIWLDVELIWVHLGVWSNAHRSGGFWFCWCGFVMKSIPIHLISIFFCHDHHGRHLQGDPRDCVLWFCSDGLKKAFNWHNPVIFRKLISGHFDILWYFDVSDTAGEKIFYFRAPSEQCFCFIMQGRSTRITPKHIWESQTSTKNTQISSSKPTDLPRISPINTRQNWTLRDTSGLQESLTDAVWGSCWCLLVSVDACWCLSTFFVSCVVCRCHIMCEGCMWGYLSVI